MIAEQTGDIGASCTFLSGAARESIDRSINTISKLVEPVLMLGMGVVVGSIALSIIMPIYEITNRINIH
jgi:general secretion pathway protein F